MQERKESKTNDLAMLFHSDIKRHIISLHESSQGVKQQNWVLVTHLQQPPSCVIHQQSMPIVHWVPQLKSEDSISLAFIKFLSELLGREPVVIEPIIILYRLQHFQVPSNKPIPSRGNGFFHVGKS